MSGIESAAVLVKDLTYSLEMDNTTVLLHDNFSTTSHLSTEGVTVRPSNTGLVITAPTAGAGSVLHQQAVDADKAKSILIHIGEVNQGRISVQALHMSKDGSFLGDTDLLTDVGSGWYRQTIDSAALNSGTQKLIFKFWLNGSAGGSARIQSFYVLP